MRTSFSKTLLSISIVTLERRRRIREDVRHVSG
jgi:hypothetical protein